MIETIRRQTVRWAVVAMSLLCVTAPLSARKKVAVVLSGGGAKGVAHVGALKVIERAGIPIDIVTGTSMGSIVGGFYAVGYNASQLDSIVRQQDWNSIIFDREDLRMQSVREREKQNTYIISSGLQMGKDRKRIVAGGGIITGNNLHNLFEKLLVGYSDSLDFNTLPIPFACVATNVVDFSEHDFHSGYLAQAMRASMAIPAVFAPVRMGNEVLVDGGMKNNYPADLAKAMGADIIIGVTVPDEPMTAAQLNTPSDIIRCIIDQNTKNKYQENLDITDLVMKVDTKNYSAASFNPSAIDTLLRRGEEEAMRHWDELMALKKRIGTIGEHDRGIRREPRPLQQLDSMQISKVEFVDMDAADEKYLRSKFSLKDGKCIDTKKAELIVTTMRIDLFYKKPSYRLMATENGMKAVFTAGPKKSTQVNLGVRFDTEEMVALQVNANVPIRKPLLPDVDLTLRLGARQMGRIDLLFSPGKVLNPTLSYIFHRDEVNIYEKGEKNNNIDYTQHAVELSVLSFNFRNLNFTGGVRWDYYHFPHVLANQENMNTIGLLEDGHYYSYFARVYYNSENNGYFPTRGSKLNAQYAYYTDNITKVDMKQTVTEVMAMWRKSFLFGSRFALQPMFYGRLLYGKNRPAMLSNLIGGEWFGHRIAQQLPFAGVGYLEYADPFFVAIQLQAQQRVGANGYLLLRGAAAQQAEKMRHLLDSSTLIGSSLSYYYNTVFGPVGGSVGYSNKTKEPYFYINLGYVF